MKPLCEAQSFEVLDTVLDGIDYTALILQINGVPLNAVTLWIGVIQGLRLAFDEETIRQPINEYCKLIATVIFGWLLQFPAMREQTEMGELLTKISIDVLISY